MRAIVTRSLFCARQPMMLDRPVPPDLRIAPPTPVQRRAWRMLMPEVAASADPCHVLVAMAKLDGYGIEPRVIGAVATAGSHQNSPIQWPRAFVHVIPPMRRRGIGGALLRAAAAGERQRGVGLDPDARPGPLALAAWSMIAPNDDGVARWRSAGFTHHVTFTEHEVTIDAIEAKLGPMLQQMTAGGWIPDDAVVVPLRTMTSVQMEQLIALHARHLGGSAQLLREQLAGRAYDPDLSMALLRAGQTVGFTLGSIQPDGVCGVDANVLDPSHRLGWANVLLKLTAARRLRDRGITRTRFQSCEQHTDTRKFARQFGGVLRREWWLMYRVFPPPPG